MKNPFGDSFSDDFIAAPLVSAAAGAGAPPPPPVLGDPIEVSDEVHEAEAAFLASGDGGPGSFVSVGGATSAGLTINLIFDAAAMAAPQSFRDGITQAMQMICAVVTDHITINLQIDYSGTGGGAFAGPTGGNFVNYSTVRADLVNNASPGDTTFNSLPTGSTIGGQSQVAVWYSQEKLWGLISPTGTEVDGSATFSTDINPNLLVGVALHELTNAMGRVPYGPQPDILEFYRFTSPGNYLFNGNSTAPASYFSLNGGNTKIADYGQTSDPSDFLNSGVQGSTDPFNEFYSGSTQQSLTAIDLKQLDALGFHLTSAVSSPDLTASFDSVSSTTLAPGGTTSVDYWVVNFGSGTAGASTSGLYLSTDPTITTGDTLLRTVSSPSLSANGTPGYYDHQTVSLTLPGNLAPGTYYIGGIADYNNTVAESNEANNNHNVTQITVTGPQAPDLTVSFDSVSSTTIAAGGSTSVDFWAVNLGKGASAASTAGLYLSTDPTITTSDTLLQTVSSPGLAANGAPGYYDHETVSLTLPGNLAPGTYYIGGIADYNNTVAESNETNNNHNVTQITVTGPQLPDLTASFDSVSSTTVAAGGSTSVDFWVVNFGHGASGASTSGLYLSTDSTITAGDTLLQTVSSPGLAASGTTGYYDHQTVSLTLPGNLAPGTYYIGGIADYNNTVAESNETNNNHNVTQITVTGPQLPDLTASFDSVSNTNLSAGGTTSVDFWVVNFGHGASGASTSGLYLSTDSTITTGDTLLQTVSSPALTANGATGYYDHQTVSLTLPGNLAPGTYYIGGIADYNNTVGESNEANNNHNVVQITVGSHGAPAVSPSAQVANTAPAPSFAGGGDSFVFRSDLGAIGQADAPAQAVSLAAGDVLSNTSAPMAHGDVIDAHDLVVTHDVAMQGAVFDPLHGFIIH